MPQRPRRSERIRGLQLKVNPRVLLLMDTGARNSRGFSTQMVILSCGMTRIPAGWMPLNWRNGHSLFRAVLVPRQRTLGRRIYRLQRVYYMNVDYRPMNFRVGDPIMAIIVDPSLELLMRDNPRRGLNLIKRIADYFMD